MTQAAIVPRPEAIFESLALRGDISGLKPVERIAYYRMLCDRLGLDPMTQPFVPMKLNGKEVMYAAKAATDQLARIHNVTRTITAREKVDDVYVVTCRASLPDGRAEESIGAVSLSGLKGEALANAMMKGETKSKRRACLSLLGLGMLDESEVETMDPLKIEPAQPFVVNADAEAQAEADDEFAQAHQKLYEVCKALKQANVEPTFVQSEMQRITGKDKRGDLTVDEVKLVTSAFGEWLAKLTAS